MTQVPIDIPFSRKQLLLAANVFFWVSLGTFDILTTGGLLNGYYSIISARFLLHAPLFALLIYPNLYYLYPNYFSKRKYFQYTLAAGALLALVIVLRIVLDEYSLWYLLEGNFAEGILGFMYDESRATTSAQQLIKTGFYTPEEGLSGSYRAGMIVATIGIFFITTPIKLVEDWYNKQQLELKLLKQQIAQNEAIIKIREEKIKFLQAQTDPHFLINALSGVYHLALVRDEHIDAAILRLSELMGYLLGHGKKDFISLKYELQFINNYIEFNKAIHLEPLNIRFEHNVSEQQLSSIEIPPMLIQPFFENAIKHGNLEDDPNSWLSSRLTIALPYLEFSIENSISPAKSKRQNTASSHGVGLNNLRERLDLLFPGKHQLALSRQPDRFRATLRLEIPPEHEFHFSRPLPLPV